MRDGGWAAAQWELWTIVGTTEPIGGTWQIDWSAFNVCLNAEPPHRALIGEEGEGPWESMRAMRTIMGILSRPSEALHPVDWSDEDDAA